MNAKEWSARYAAHLKRHRPKMYREAQESEVDPICRTTGPGCLVGSVAVPIF
jgi:hypothetical protein